ncbi:cardiolipin synthetase 2 [Microbacteriaceae bacterium MWH-Ta3]|nr:cardiolipin synthetase 2 [Microbacteriaceae bacterium MWH-Ta3]
MSSDAIALIVLGALLAGDLVIRVVSLIWVPRNRRPQTALAWLLLIHFVPYVGFLVFLLLGSNRLPRARRRKQDDINAYLRALAPGIESDALPDRFAHVATLNRQLGSMPLTAGNSVSFQTDYRESIAELTRAVQSSQHTVHIEFYIVCVDEVTAGFFEAITQAVARGVTVRFLYDHLASARIPHYHRTVEAIRATGAQVHASLPVRPWRGRYQRPDLRNHRKIMVVDSRVAYTGSQNIIDPSYHRRGRKGLRWSELLVRLEGPVVASLDALFVTDWWCETEELITPHVAAVTDAPAGDGVAQVVPSGPTFDGENNLRLFNALLYSATRRIALSSPYFVPDSSLRYAVTTAAQSGITVDLYVSAAYDQPLVFHAQCSYYDELLAAGVNIWLYPEPTLLHSKFVLIDDDIAVVGSSNLDMRSFSLNLESSVMFAGSAVADLADIEREYRAVSHPLTAAEWNARPFRRTIQESLARLTATVQ